MLLRFLYLQLILLLPNNCLAFTYNVGKIVTEPKTDEENIFNDVIKNISRVNDALQNLIRNYEQIQKLYATDSFEKDYSSDAEIDEFYKIRKKNKKTKSRTNLEDIKQKKTFPATVMFLSDENEYEMEDNESETDKEDQKTITDLVVEATTKHIVQKIRLHDTKDNRLIETLQNSSINEKHKNRRPQVIILHPQHREQFKNVDSNKKQLASSTKQQKRKRRKPHNTIPTEANTETTTDVPRQRSRNVEKVIFAESFPQGKIWKEIAQKKPIKLRALKMPHFEMQKIRFRSDNKSHKTALVIVTKNNKRTENSLDIPSSLEHVFSSDSEELNTKIIRASILRDDYGMACLRLVVKKCYKACKQTIKAACRVTTCKNSFKEKFLDNAKKGCIKEFRHNDTSQKDDTGTKFLKKYSKSDFEDKDDDDEDFADITRSGFPAETCYPFMIPQTQRDKPETNNNSTLTPVDVEKKILRDRFERACARASSDKCNNACLYAYTTTCDTYECSKGKKKHFRKHCKRQCKNAYKPKRQFDTSSDSSSSSTSKTSESGSDSSDDFNTEDFE